MQLQVMIILLRGDYLSYTLWAPEIGVLCGTCTKAGMFLE